MKTIDALKTTLARHAAEYARGRGAHPSLALLAAPDAVLDALALGSSATHAERDAVTLALITEHQRAAHPLWQSLLLVAYEPMLAGVLKRTHDKRDRESRVVLAFLEALARVSLAHPPSLLALHLRHATERGVFGTGAAARLEPKAVSLDRVARRASPEDPEAALDRRRREEKIAGELHATFGDDAPRLLAILLRARTGSEPLAALIDEWHPDLRTRERTALYERWQRLRHQALAHLEARFGREVVA